MTLILVALRWAIPLAGCGGDDDGAGDQATGVDATMAVSGATGADGRDDADGTDTPSDDGDDGDGGSKVCQHACSRDDDCLYGGTYTWLICSEGTCADGCTSDAECGQRRAGSPLLPCSSSAECVLGPCIDIGGGHNGCALERTEFSPCLLPTEEITVQSVEGDDVSVCAPRMYCHTERRVCVPRCIEGVPCGGLVCNPDSGKCECTSDDECAGGTCESGACWASNILGECSGDADCANPFDGGTAYCG